jgi:hypothetical protein
MVGRGVGTRGVITSSAEVAALVQTDSPEEIRNRIREKPIEGGYLPIQDSSYVPVPEKEESNEALKKALLGAVKNKDTAPRSVPGNKRVPGEMVNPDHFNAPNSVSTPFQERLAEIHQKAMMSGKEIHGMPEYQMALKDVLKVLVDTTGLKVQASGSTIMAFWFDEIYTGINKIHLGSTQFMGFSIMSPDDPNVEDNLAQVQYGSSVEEFQRNLEDFFCILYSRNFGIQ